MKSAAMSIHTDVDSALRKSTGRRDGKPPQDAEEALFIVPDLQGAEDKSAGGSVWVFSMQKANEMNTGKAFGDVCGRVWTC